MSMNEHRRPRAHKKNKKDVPYIRPVNEKMYSTVSSTVSNNPAIVSKVNLKPVTVATKEKETLKIVPPLLSIPP